MLGEGAIDHAFLWVSEIIGQSGRNKRSGRTTRKGFESSKRVSFTPPWMVKRNPSDLKRATCVISSVSCHFERCQMWLWFLCFALFHILHVLLIFFLPFALGFMPFCRISSAFLFLGFYSHLKLLVHFRASCYMIKTEKGSHSRKHRMEKGTTEASHRLWCAYRVGGEWVFFLKTTTTSSITGELGAWE